jgi:hypothetical protein
MNPVPHIPILRLGQPYRSMDLIEIKDRRTGQLIANVSQANNGLIRRDFLHLQDSFNVLNELSCEDLIAITKKAGELFMNETLPLSVDGQTQSPEEFVQVLSATSGLPHVLCRKNMAKIYEVFTEIDHILNGLTRGLDPKIIDDGVGEQMGYPVSFFPETISLGAVLPSNSPGVNSIWMPSIPLKIPVILKPGRDEPWTPYRIIQSFIAAGCPKEAFGFYPTTHEGANTIMTECGRSIIFGDEKTVARYADNPKYQVHGPGWSKILLGDDCVEQWKDYIDIMVESVLLNGGRSCINTSAIITPKYGKEIAQAIAERLAQIKPQPIDSNDAHLSAFANPAFADYIDNAIDTDLQISGAEDLTAQYRTEPRKVEFDNQIYLLPTVIYCDSIEHPLANREFLFPYTSVVEIPQGQMIDHIGESLVVSAVTNDKAWTQKLLLSHNIKRLNVGPICTCKVTWDQPHEGNLFEFLYTRRAIQYSNLAVA